MIVDFITKPTQGSLFNNFRYLIMGVTPIKSYIQKSDTKNKSK